MKRTVALALLGMAAATTAFGQGAFIFNNYATPYVPITGQGSNLDASSGVQISVWWGPGDVSASALVFGANANWSTFAGYTDRAQVFTIPAADYVPGGTWTLQLRASGTLGGAPVDSVASRGPLLVTANIGNQEITPPELPTILYSPGFNVVVVPEPTTFALAGLGAAALLIFRRRD